MSQDVVLALPLQEMAFDVTDVEGMELVAECNCWTPRTSECCSADHRTGKCSAELRLCTHCDSGKPGVSQETYLLRLFTDPSTLWGRGVSLIVSNFPSPFAASSVLSLYSCWQGGRSKSHALYPTTPHPRPQYRSALVPQGSLLPQHIFSASHN